MFNFIHSGKINHVIQGFTPEANTEHNFIKKYHTYFRQRDTLKSIPKELEEVVKVKDPENYEAEVNTAAERKSALLESRTETLPVYDMNYFGDGTGFKKEEKKEETSTVTSIPITKKPKKYNIKKK